MKMQKLSQEINQIQMPEEMKSRIKNHCYSKLEIQNEDSGYYEREEKIVKKYNRSFRKPMAAAVLTVCFCLIGVTALASSGKIEGFFKDIVRWDGAVVGTSYEQATDEINVSGIVEAEELKVKIEMVEPNMAPYSFLETFKIGKYEIVDANGKVAVEGNETEDAELVDGKVEVIIPIAELLDGNYKLVIDEFVGSAKADQPLTLSGTWECEFTR